jgi:hypothetical protein
MVVESAQDALECWNNVREVMHRLFLLSPRFSAKWDAVASSLSQLMTRRKESLPLLRGHGIAFNLLNSLAYTFFNRVNRPEVTPELVEAALAAFHLDPDCDWFRTIYTTADRAVGHTKKRSAPSATSSPAEGNSHDRPKKKADTKSHRREKKQNICFKFNSTAGCPRSDCRFSHGTIPKDDRANVVSSLQKLNLVPDPAKLE